MLKKADFVRESVDFLHRYTMKVLQKKAEEYGITVPQARVIAETLSHKQVTIKQLNQNLKMTQSTISDIVERLVTKEILVKKQNPKDKRSSIISVSDKIANEVEKSITTIVNESFVDVLNSLHPEEQEKVEEGMSLLISAVKNQMETKGLNSSDFFDVIMFPGEDSK